MPLPADVQTQLAHAFGGVRSVAVDPASENLALPWSAVAVSDETVADGALVVVSAGEDLTARVERAARCVRPGGSVVVLCPAGARGVRGAVRRLLSSKARAQLEAACEALLHAHLARVRAQPVGRDGWLAWGLARADESP